MRKAAIVAMLAMLASLLIVVPALASHPEASLAGSNFEIDLDANLKVDDPGTPGSLDWANVDEVRATDLATGTNDDSYKGGVKEDTSCPDETTGSIPNNKSDLLTFSVYEEEGTGGHPGFLNMAWSRVTDPSGTTLMDFEFNQSDTDCSVGPNKTRTAGDLLIEYSIDQGGARANITGRTWSGTAWGAPQDLDAPSPLCPDSNGEDGPCAAGTINTSPIPFGESDKIITSGSLAPRTFGEAQLDLRLIFNEDECTSFGSAMLKSRSSDSFTSQLKDFIRPASINLTNCGQVIIRKETIPDEDPNATDFGYTKSFGTDPVTTNTFTLKDDGMKTFTGVLFGTGYTVDEDVIPTNWALASIDCSVTEHPSVGVTPIISVADGTVTFDIDADTDVLDCTYTNQLQLGALKILKNSTKGGAVSQAGAVFSVDGPDADTAADFTVKDNNTPLPAGTKSDEEATVGVVCVSGLALGTYTVNETSPPPGYGDASQTDLMVTVVTGTNCTNNQPTGTGVATFTNPPLADIQVNFRDGGSGETSAQSITCTNTDTTADTTPAAGWTDSVTHEDISIDPSPRTIVCTIVIDP
jgi:Prealbumin-like fold domain